MKNGTFRKCAAGAAALLAIGCAAPASAQSPSPLISPSPAGGGGPGWGSPLLPLPPADTGKPLVFDAPAARLVSPPPPAPADCRLLLSCRAQLVGESGRHGAVELKLTPFSW